MAVQRIALNLILFQLERRESTENLHMRESRCQVMAGWYLLFVAFH